MRRKRAVKRKTKADPIYNNKLVAHFINSIMKKGKKSTAEKIVYNAINIINKKGSKVSTETVVQQDESQDSSVNKRMPVEAKSGDDQLALFKKAVDNVKPLLEVKSRRVGGATYQVPVDVKSERRISLAIRWIINAAKAKHGKSMEEKLATELIDAANNTGVAVKKKEDTHKMAEANRAFVHYRW